MTTYLQAKSNKKSLEALLQNACNAMQVFPKCEMGITPDDVKKSESFQLAKKAYDIAFQNVRNFNGFFIKTFKKEYAQDRKLKTY